MTFVVVAFQSQLSQLLPVVAEVLPRVARITLLIAIGVFLANLAVGFGVVERVAGLSRFLTGPANLPDEVGTAILTTAASTTAGYGMLAEFRESGMLDDRATLVAVTINTFFGFVQHIFTFYAPIMIPLLGLQVGILYVGSRALIALSITITGILAGTLLLSSANVDRSATSQLTAARRMQALTAPKRLSARLGTARSRNSGVSSRVLLSSTRWWSSSPE